MGNNTNKSIKDVLINILLFIVLVILLALPAYLCYKTFLVNAKADEKETQIDVVPEETQDTQSDLPEEKVKVEQGDPYEEFFPIIEDQQAYVVVPATINRTNSPTLIIYSHGSNTTVTQNMDDQFMKDMQEYGAFFTQDNYIFAASNQHGVNWGNEASLRDTLNLVNWVSENYFIKPQVYLIGFSMGGLPTMNFAAQNPELVSKIALLAPTTRASEWNQTRANKIMDIDIKIWHGNADVNVPYSSTVNFTKAMSGWGKDIEFVTLDGKSHFDLDTEYMQDILDFFNSSN